jgi:hypothetical protein
MGAPVCHVPGTEEIGQPDPKTLPNIPIATDLSSALTALNAMRQWMYSMRGGNGSGDGGTGSGRGGRVGGKKEDPQKKIGRWNEISRTKEKKKIFNPEDKEQWVEVERINSLTFQDSLTKEQWIWKR